MTTDIENVLSVPAREIPIPSSVSPEAQAYLARGPMPAFPYPPLHDVNAWHTLIAAIEEMSLGRLKDSGKISEVGFEVDEISVDGVTVFIVTPPDVGPEDTRVYLEPHGGAFYIGRGELCRAVGIMTATQVRMRVWAVDYRMSPDHPYPAAVDDCLAAYRFLLREHRPEEIVVGGVSAGGNLTAALILRARDEGLPLPAAAVMATPGVDFTRSGDTGKTNLGVDTVLTSDDPSPLQLYAGDHNLTAPYLSPLYGDFTKGFPPTILASGTRDILLSDTVRMHRALCAAAVPAELHVLEAAPHGFFGGGTPEDDDLDREIRRFIEEHCPARQ